uniref:OSJNBb0096E05.7 protein n=1 Tax=Oryza sativa subsp. japonica TaxID=39947 RepID=Q7XW55_ORYSJ|nr:OSJNBb0096E05.7 [Oryza sativa Japonica Group]
MAPGQPVNPRLLMREQPQHSGQVANRLTQDQVAAMFLPPQPVVDPIQQQPIQQQPIQQTPPIQQPYPDWFERVPLPNQFKVPDLSKFLGQDGVSTYEHISRFLAQCGEASAIDALKGMIAPIREKFLSEDFDSLSHPIQKVTLHEHRFAEVRKSSKKVNHVCPYIYGLNDDEDDSEIAAAEWVRSKNVIPCQWVKSSGKEEKYDFGITKADKIFDLLLREKQIQLSAGHTIPSAEELGKKRYCKWHNSGSHSTNDCKVFREQIQVAIEGGKISDIVESSSRSYNKGNRLRQTRVSVHQRLGPVNQDHGQEDNVIRKNQWCPSGIFTKNQKRRVQRLRNRERLQEVEQEINHRLKKAKPRQEWRVKNLVPVADDVAADEAKRLAKGKSVVTAPVNMVFTLLAEFGIDQADVDEAEEESAKLVLSPEQAVFEKPEGTENQYLKPLYINGYVNGKPMSKMMVDGEAAVNLMPYATFRKLGRNAEDFIKTNMMLKDFGGNPSETKGVLNVELTVDSKTIPTTFFVIDGKGSYSLLLGRDWIHANCCIPSTMHQCLIQWQGDKIEIMPADSQSKMENPSYYFEGVVEGSNVYTKDTVDDLDDKQGQGFMSADDLVEIDIGPGDRPRPTFISKNLSPEFRTKLIELLKGFRDCFAWEYYEMPGVSQSIVENRLPIILGVRPHQQPPRRYKADMLEPVKAEIKRLYDAGCIRPCRYTEWVSSIVPVIKKNDKVRSKEIEDHITDLRKVFERTRKYGLKMNPTKCAFGVSASQFLGFLVHERGIELEPFTPLVEIESRSAVYLGAEQQKALDNIKEYLSSPPVLIPPQKGIPFRLYLSAGEKSIGSVLIQELEGKERVVFYLSRRLLDAEARYSPMEKLCLCLYFSCTRLRHYLLSNECTVICKAHVVKDMLSAPILKGRVEKWIFSLTEFDLRYESLKAIKGQAMADFIVEHHNDSIGSVDIVPWTLFFDRSGACFEFAYTIKPYATNNQAEYEAVLKGLQLLKEVEADAIEIMGDSLLIISQLAGEYGCKNDTLIVYYEKCHELMKEFRLVTLKHVSREQNVEANDLAQGASGYKPMIKDVKVEIAAMTADDWRYDVHQYLNNPSQSASRKLRYKPLKYTLLDDEVYYWTIDGVLLKCLSADQAKVAIGEVHEGICGTHQLAHKMKWLLWCAGYFWPTMLEDCFRYYKGCQDCQKFGAIQRAPTSAMNPIIKPWPFGGWGIDMIGMINPPSSKGHKFILVATDYFTKWVQAIALKKVDSGDAIQLVQEHIIYRFGIP